MSRKKEEVEEAIEAAKEAPKAHKKGSAPISCRHCGFKSTGQADSDVSCPACTVKGKWEAA